VNAANESVNATEPVGPSTSGNAATSSSGVVQTSGTGSSRTSTPTGGGSRTLASASTPARITGTPITPVTVPAGVVPAVPRRPSSTLGAQSSHVVLPHAVSPSLLGASISSGTLPFTGLALLGWLAFGVTLLSLGLGLRRSRWSAV